MYVLVRQMEVSERSVVTPRISIPAATSLISIIDEHVVLMEQSHGLKPKQHINCCLADVLSLAAESCSCGFRHYCLMKLLLRVDVFAV